MFNGRESETGLSARVSALHTRRAERERAPEPALASPVPDTLPVSSPDAPPPPFPADEPSAPPPTDWGEFSTSAETDEFASAEAAGDPIPQTETARFPTTGASRASIEAAIPRIYP